METRERISVQVLPTQKRALAQMAQSDGESMSVLMRRLIVAEARRRGFWPPLPEKVMPLQEVAQG